MLARTHPWPLAVCTAASQLVSMSHAELAKQRQAEEAAICSLPVELLHLCLAAIDDQRTLASLGSTCSLLKAAAVRWP